MGALIQEVQEGYDFPWLPEGRRVVRDKRIPRDNLNGFQIQQQGINWVVTYLTGVGSRVAQDPPHYANVVTFNTDQEHDVSQTQLVDWHGWVHDRWIDFRHNGEPILILDTAAGQYPDLAVISWHINNKVTGTAPRYILREGDLPVEMVLLPLDSNGTIKVTDHNHTVDYIVEDTNRLGVMTLFLFGEWIGAQTEMLPKQLKVSTQTQAVAFDLPSDLLIKE